MPVRRTELLHPLRTISLIRKARLIAHQNYSNMSKTWVGRKNSLYNSSLTDKQATKKTTAYVAFRFLFPFQIKLLFNWHSWRSQTPSHTILYFRKRTMLSLRIRLIPLKSMTRAILLKRRLICDVYMYGWFQYYYVNGYAIPSSNVHQTNWDQNKCSPSLPRANEVAGR